MEPDIRNADTAPREQAGNGGQVLEPLECFGSASSTAAQISKERDRGSD